MNLEKAIVLYHYTWKMSVTAPKILIHVSLAYLPPQLMKKILPESPDLLHPTHLNLSKSIWTLDLIRQKGSRKKKNYLF